MHLRLVVRIFNNRYPVDNRRQAKWFRFYKNVKKMNELVPVHTLSGFHTISSVASQDQPTRQGRQLFPFHHMRP